LSAGYLNFASTRSELNCIRLQVKQNLLYPLTVRANQELLVRSKVNHLKPKLDLLLLSFHNLDIYDFFDCFLDIEIRRLYSEFISSQLRKGQHVIDYIVEDFCARSLDLDAF
jgi:hypothetical protein